jgi:hypothetical protein
VHYETPYDEELRFPVHVIVDEIPATDLELIKSPYTEIGYKFLPLLKKTDIRRLVEAYGEPRSHVSMRERFRERWEGYRDAAKARLTDRIGRQRFDRLERPST